VRERSSRRPFRQSPPSASPVLPDFRRIEAVRFCSVADATGIPTMIARPGFRRRFAAAAPCRAVSRCCGSWNRDGLPTSPAATATASDDTTRDLRSKSAADGARRVAIVLGLVVGPRFRSAWARPGRGRGPPPLPRILLLAVALDTAAARWWASQTREAAFPIPRGMTACRNPAAEDRRRPEKKGGARRKFR